MNKGQSVFESKQKSKGQVAVFSLVSLLSVAGVVGFGVTQYQDNQKVSPKKITNLMLDNAGGGGGLPTSFTIPE